MGAASLLFAATQKDLKPGDYVVPCGLGGFKGYPVVAAMAPHAHDVNLRRQTWAWLEEATGFTLKV